jgi:hypothetical protein
VQNSVILIVALAWFLFGAQSGAQTGGTWTQSKSAASTGGLQNPVLLTDGTVIAEEFGSTRWWKLSPDVFGNYANGFWTQIASTPGTYSPLDFVSGVLPDGRVLIEGGECSTTPCTSAQVDWTSLGAIYDPLANTWTSVAPPSGPGWLNTGAPPTCNGGIGGGPGIVLPNGTFMVGAGCAFPNVEALFNPTTLTWTATGAPGSPTRQGEQGYTLLQTDKVLTIDTHDGSTAWAYDQGLGSWSQVASTPTPLNSPCLREMGPAVSRHDGTVVAFGAITTCSGNPNPILLYNPFNNTWAQGPNLPSLCGTNGMTLCSLADAPAVVLPSGNILFPASADFQQTPAHWFEFSTAGIITQVSDDSTAASLSAYFYNGLMLPSGQALVASGARRFVEFYTPTGSYNPAWAPVITSAPKCISPGDSYFLTGVQLNGLSQGDAYGDDYQATTNYPLVRVVNNATGHVFYARTFNPSSRSVAPGKVGSTHFQVASMNESGPGMLYAVANGIPSVGISVTVGISCPSTHDFNGDGKSDIAWRDTSGDVAFWLMSGAAVSSTGGIGGIPSTWSIVGQRDFDGDGMVDLLWHDTSGNTAMWFMNGTAVRSTASVGNIPTSWSVIGVGDFNGDGLGDIIWRDSSGNVAVWLMNGATLSSGVVIGNVPLTWNIVGAGDYNGDGKSDLLWRDNLGNTAIWFMNGTAVASSAGVGNIPTNWSVVGTGDFNGDGKADIVWRDIAGDAAIWLMNGATISSASGIGTIPTTWSIVQTGDYNGDGMSDLLWRDTSGNTAMWFMNGTTLASTGGVGTIPTNWTVQSVNAE